MKIINIQGPSIHNSGVGNSPSSASVQSLTAPATEVPRQPIEDLLIKVGKIVLRDELHSEFIGIGKVARIAQKYKIKWAGMTHKTKQLESLALHLFEHQDSILGDGIKITWRTERDGEENELQLRFHHYDPANDGPMPNGTSPLI